MFGSCAKYLRTAQCPDSIEKINLIPIIAVMLGFTALAVSGGGPHAEAQTRAVFPRSSNVFFPADVNLQEIPKMQFAENTIAEQTRATSGRDDEIESILGYKEPFHWKAALGQSFRFLMVEHAHRIWQEEDTRANLRGPFLKDWASSVANLRGWDDGDEFYVNYIGHPMQGAVSGFIQIQNDPNGRSEVIHAGKSYWLSRTKAMFWAAAYSVQFEIGPLSESSLGNVGLKPTPKSAHPQAYVDLVITPTLGTAWLVGEDALDRYVISRFEQNTENRTARLLLRSFLNPSRSFANVLRGKFPWYRDTRERDVSWHYETKAPVSYP